jgi:hypothetical protein
VVVEAEIVLHACEAPETCPLVAGCSFTAGSPCHGLTAIHARKLALCAALEAVADTLPSSLDRLECLRIASDLVPLLRQGHRYEEDLIFPLFVGSDTRAGARLASVARLRAEHVEDECAAQDLTDALMQVGHGGLPDNPEAFGFMLRAFFEAIRRHIAFEREHVLPVMQGTLR